MCKPCATAAECTATATTTAPTRAESVRSQPARRRTRKPTQLEELKRVAAAALHAVGSFNFLMTEDGWWETADDGTPEAAEVVAEFLAAGRLIKGATDLLARSHRKQFWDDALAPHTYGSYLRHAARLMDGLDRDMGVAAGVLDENDHEYHPLELYPHLLAERSARDAHHCPLCGSQRVFHIICADEDEGGDVQAWVCNTCEGDVRKAKQVLKAKRVDKRHTRAVPKASGKKKAKVGNAKEGKAAGESNGPDLVNRIAAISD